MTGFHSFIITGPARRRPSLGAAFAAFVALALLSAVAVAGCGSQATGPSGSPAGTVSGAPDSGGASAGGNGSGATTSTVTYPDTGGRMQLDETSFDFGDVPVGQKVDHAFVIRNTGAGPLKLGPLSVKRLEGC